jgi:cellobiose-specific phosphotransferase system component IIC
MSNWIIFFWVVGIHVIEIVGVAIFLLIRRNNAVEKALMEQQQYIDAKSIIIENSDQQI